MKRFLFVFFVFFLFVSSVFAQDDKPFARSTLPPDNLKDVFLEVTDVHFVLYYDAYIRNFDGVVYKKFAEAFYDISVPRTVNFNDIDKNSLIGTLKAVDPSSLRIWIKSKDKIEPYTISGPKITTNEGPDANRLYLRIIGLPENFYRLIVIANYSVQGQSAIRVLTLSVTRPIEDKK